LLFWRGPGGPMIAPLRLLCVFAALALIAGQATPAAAQPMPKPRPAASDKNKISDKAKITTDTKVYLLRGLLNIFSLGMDALSDKLNAMGIQAEVFNHDSWPAVAARIIEDHKAGKQGAVVLIGHSLGADVLFNLTERLERENIPVRLVVPFDPTSSYEVTKNVDHLLNFYQLNGFGRRVTAPKGYKGELVNMDLSKDESFGHGSIDKAPQLHDLVIAKIKKVAIGPAPRKRAAPAKPKPVLAQETPKEMPAIPFIVQPQTTQ
jgi:thioesterase domain-containing protein